MIASLSDKKFGGDLEQRKGAATEATHLWFLMTEVSQGEDLHYFRKPLGINGMASLCPVAVIVGVRLVFLSS